MSRRAAVAIVLLATAFAAAITATLRATSGGSPRLTKAEYSRQVTAIYRRVDERLRRGGAPRSDTEISAGLRQAAAALERAAAALERLRPPEDAERDHRLLVGATHDYAAELDLVRASVDFGDPATIAAHLHDVTAPAAIARALRDLAALGYRIRVTVAPAP